MPVHVAVDHISSLSDLERDEPDAGERLIAVGVRSGSIADDAPGADADLLEAAGFEGEACQTTVANTDDGMRLLVGLGERCEPRELRKIGAAVAKAARTRSHVAVDLLRSLEPADRLHAATVLTEGLALGSYAFDRYKDRADDVRLSRATVVSPGGRKVSDGVLMGGKVAAAVALVRDLVNTPGGDLTPEAFAEVAVGVARVEGLEIEVYDRAAIAEMGLGGLLGVSRGSAQEPRLVKIHHAAEGARPKGRVALVGKGITFDSGGLSIKSASGMESMKTDMAGAATVLGAMSLLPWAAPRMDVTAYIPLTDNMLGPDATRVGDVLRMRDGTTVEVLNTDAEGRLVLADALALAAEERPDAIIDLATLTGACIVALGERTAGLMSNHEALAERVEAAAAGGGEAVWRLPMPDHLRGPLDSEIADLRNIGTSPYGGALTAAIFLREFVDDLPWAHLDIAGPSNSSSAYDSTSKGGTGYGVATLTHLLANWSRLPKPGT